MVDTVVVPSVERVDHVENLVNTVDADLDALTVLVDTVDSDLTTLEYKVASLKTTERPWEQIVVTEGSNDLAVQEAVAKVFQSATGSDSSIQKKLVFPPGEYHLTQPLITPAREDTTRYHGLAVEGQGIRSTKIYWDNPSAVDDPSNSMINNFITSVRLLRWADIGGFSIYSNGIKNRFAYLYGDTSGYNQAWNIHDIEFSGAWDRVFGIDGGSTANLNSEMVLRRLFTSTNSVFRDAFFRSGGISGVYNQQNQFLNYWVEDCCLTLSAGTVFKLEKGGGVRVNNGSWSAASAANKITWFSMPLRNSNNNAASQLDVRNVKFEPKGDEHRIIDCAWGTGTVTFENCSDHGSMQNTASYARNLHRYTGQNPWNFGGTMPVVRYKSCALAGYHYYSGPSTVRGNIVYDGCYFYRGDNGQLANAVSSTNPVLKYGPGEPKYRFQDCDNVINTTNI